MFLKQLELAGFKSFARRSRIDFEKGVTAVVGPNGSGKSNITDAIRWVLGEQSARSLRGAKMEDIIFNGSEGKRALNVAEVSLVLDNSDGHLPVEYHEVSVTRRLYRSGESEFLLNQKPCRLKDIVDLFRDTGIGREAYSVIGQGKIDEILNSKAEEKRKIFEDAAGVLKYKSRKEQSEKKLIETKEHLRRVDDILHELNTRSEPLKEAAEKARLYLQKKEEMDKLAIGLLVAEITRLHEDWESLQHELETMKEKDVQLSANITSQETETESIEYRLKQFDERMANMQEKRFEASREAERLEGERSVLQERLKQNERERRSLVEQMQTLRAELEELQSAASKTKKDYDDKKNDVQSLQKKLNTLQKHLQESEAALELKIEELKSDYIEVLNEHAVCNNEKRALADQRKQLQQKKEKFKKRQEAYVQKQYELKQNGCALKEKKRKVAEMIKAHARDQERLQQELAETEQQLRKNKAKQENLNRELDDIKSRQRWLNELEEGYRGFYQGVKEVLQAKSTLEGIYGAVASLISVHHTHELAIETALGGALQHIVVEDERHARMAIDYLKKKKAGRATFLPLAQIKVRTLAANRLAKVQGHPAFVGVASSLVHCQPKFEKAVQSLLGSVLVARDLQGAGEIARILGYKERIVTLDGDVIHAGGLMTGGARKANNVPLLARKREISDLKKAEKNKKTELDRKIESWQKLNETRKTLLAKIKEIEIKQKKLWQEDEALKNKLFELNVTEKNIEEQVGVHEQEQDGLLVELNETEQKLESLEQRLEHTQKKEKSLKLEIERLTKEQQTRSATKEEMKAKMTDLKVDLAAETKQVEHLRIALEETNEKLLRSEKMLHSHKEKVSSLAKQIQTLKEQDEKLSQSFVEKKQEKEAIEDRIRRERAERERLEQELHDRRREIKELKRQQIQHEARMKEKEFAHRRLGYDLDHRLMRLQEDYELSFEAAQSSHPLQTSVEEARQKVGILKREIDALGDVHPGAVEEYRRLKERLDFLQSQKEDLLTAEKNLRQVIAEMDQEVSRRFSDTFRAVKQAFQHVFKSLFGGGRCDLVLTNPEDVLTSGVEVMAEPPGKKLQNLTLLSGGERALTAIALLFAILQVRPVPFCVLDEVEAALDEANVGRFATFLRSFSTDTQFIVVTHRKKTMEEADVLYGVTMNDSGTSELVSVRLEEAPAPVASS